MGIDAAALIVLGGMLLGVAWMCWTGRWKAWSRIAMLPAMPIAAAPGLGLCLLFAGLALLLPSPVSDILLGLGIVASLAGFAIAIWNPRWYGPRWFRERGDEYDLSVPLNAAIATSVRTELGHRASEAVARSHMGGREPDASWRAHLVSDEHGRPSAMQRAGLVRGHLLLYPDTLIFAADAGEDRMRGSAVVELLPARAIVSAERVPSRSQADGGRRRAPDLPTLVRPCLRVNTTDGALVFETASAARRARELETRYVAARSAAPAAS
jgi:hypothetical protein